MPIPFEDLSKPDNADSVAWLRFVDEKDGTGMRAALFETTSRGDSLGFFFSRIDRHDPTVAQANEMTSRQSAVLFLAKSLFRSATGSPSLIFGLADEIPQEVVTDALRIVLPFCRVKLGNGSGPQLQWATKRPGEATREQEIFNQVMARDDPFEAFGRAAECLNRAFEYKRVHGVTAIAGLHAVVHLCRPSAGQVIVRSGVAERLWRLGASQIFCEDERR